MEEENRGLHQQVSHCYTVHSTCMHNSSVCCEFDDSNYYASVGGAMRHTVIVRICVSVCLCVCPL